MSDAQETQETTAATEAEAPSPTEGGAATSDDAQASATAEAAGSDVSAPEPQSETEPAAEQPAATEPAPTPAATAETEAVKPASPPPAGRSAGARPAAPPEPDPAALDPRKRVPPVYRANQGPSQSRFRPRNVATDVPLEQIHYKNIEVLAQFLDRQGRILSRRKTRVSAKKQRRLKTAIKQARHLALLPYTPSHIRGRR